MKLTGKKIFYTAAVLFLIILSYFYFHEKRPLLWQEGARQMYGFSLRTVINASQSGAGALHEIMEMRGTLNFRIFSVAGGKIRAGFQLSPLNVRKSGVPGKAAEDIYSKLFFADISEEGIFLNFYFSNDIALEDESGIQDIMRFFQAVVRDSFFSTWEAEEDDSGGTYIAGYKAEDGFIRKTKKKYIELVDKEGFIKNDEAVDIKKSDCVYYYDNNASWLKKASGQELLLYSSKGGPFLKSSVIYDLGLIPFNPDESLAIWNGGINPDEQIALWAGLAKNSVSLARKSDVDRLTQKFGKRTFSEIADGLFKIYDRFEVNCLKELIEYLTLHPERAADIPDYLLSKKLNPEQQITLIHALERTGMPEAQKALSVIMNGEKFTKGSRTQAAIGLGKIEKPTKEALGSLWQAYENRSSGAVDANHIAATAVLALGSQAGGLAHSPVPAYRETSRSIRDRIVSDLAAKQDLNTKVALLHAAGNIADREMYDVITSYFNDDNPNVRVAAVTSLVNMDDEIVNGTLSEKLDREQDINVRNSIVETMYYKKATEETVNNIIRKISAEENDIVRGEMYRYLLKNRDIPGVRDSLKELLVNERSAEHRKIIRTALSTKKKAAQDKG